MKRKMGKNVIMTISYKEDKDSIITELDVIAARERKSRSEVIVGLIEQFVKAHSAGNDTFKLDTWSEEPNFKVLPTLMAEDLKWMSYLEGCDDKELSDLMIKLIKRKQQIALVENKRARENNRPSRWKLDLPAKNVIPLMQGDK